MTRYDPKNRTSAAQSLKPQDVTGAADGTGVDLKGYNAALCVLDLGASTGADQTLDIRLEDSADNSSFSAVAAANIVGGLIAQLTATDDDAILTRGYNGSKRYLRWSVTAVGGTSTPTFPLSASIIRGNAQVEPA
jgi:hypothetical protein